MEILQGILQMVIAFAGVAIHGFDGRPRHPVRRHAARVIAFAGVAVFAGWLRGMPVWPQVLPAWVTGIAVAVWGLCACLFLMIEHEAETGSGWVALAAGWLCIPLLILAGMLP